MKKHIKIILIGNGYGDVAALDEELTSIEFRIPLVLVVTPSGHHYYPVAQIRAIEVTDQKEDTNGTQANG